MTTKGPKPKPATLRALEGDHHKSRYNLAEPHPGSILDVNAVPDRVRNDPAAYEMWTFLVPRLVTMGVAGDVDKYAMEALCVTYGMWSLRPSAQMTTKLQSLLSEFGLTPSSRTRLVGALPHEQKSTMAQIIGG